MSKILIVNVPRVMSTFFSGWVQKITNFQTPFRSHSPNISYLVQKHKLDQHSKVIFMFNNPYNTVLSMRRYVINPPPNQLDPSPPEDSWPVKVSDLRLHNKEYKIEMKARLESYPEEMVFPLDWEYIMKEDNPYAGNLSYWKDYPVGKLIYLTDFFQLEKHFDTWYTNTEDFHFMTMNSEKMWDNIDTIKEFLGEDIKDNDFSLPPKLKRQSDWKDMDESLQRCLEKVYGSLYEKYEKADDIKIWR